ncbi:MAG: dual specificity protein phosphatase family protein [Proteobacteria bacterium]|nr:dual specificity protein phosphatase family protein [Pseudomonadota bacterium]MBU1059895.1 dual specificity protein phosphatase family protein [Pseudomonadota bacterium]
MEYSQQWFYTKMKVAKFPAMEEVQAGEYDDVTFRINVSDIFQAELDNAFACRGIRNYWFPLGEAFGMPLESLYGAMRIIKEAEQQNQSLLLHCHAGRNRSVLVADCYHFLSTLHHRKQDQQGLPYARNNPNRLQLNCDDGQLPGIYKMEEFLESCRETFTESFAEPDRPMDWIKHELHMKGSGFSDLYCDVRPPPGDQ